MLDGKSPKGLGVGARRISHGFDFIVPRGAAEVIGRRDLPRRGFVARVEGTQGLHAEGVRLMGRRIGVFGGSFDPIHWGHLLLAEYCREQASLDEVRFIPAFQSPHKRMPHVDGKKRWEMVQLAIWGNPFFVADDRELRRTGRSFTVDTLEELASAFPGSELFLMMGADSAIDFPHWHRPERILELAQLLVVERGGHREVTWEALLPLLGQQRLEIVQSLAVQFPEVELSSSEIRRRIQTGASIRYQVPRGVEELIRAERLYQADRGAE